MIPLILGVILGMMVRDIKCKCVKAVELELKKREGTGSTQFFEAETLQEKFNRSKTIDDLIDK